jgi:hypothetical protein
MVIMVLRSTHDHLPRGIIRTTVSVLCAGWLVAAVSVGVAEADKTKGPNVSVTSPAAGQVVSGTTTLAARAANAVSVTWLVDGAAVARDNSPGWSQPWDSASVEPVKLSV